MTSHAFLLVAAALLILAIAPRAVAADPADYEKEFRQRSDFYLRQVATEDPTEIMAWAKRISLGDPHKYAMPVIIARLALDPKDEKALAAYRASMEVDKEKADRGLYHFAVYLRTRMFFMLPGKLPKDITDSMLYDVRNFYRQMRAGGTENHAWMHRASGYLWAEYLPEVGSQKVPAKPDDKSPADITNKQWQIDFLRREIKKFYTAGQGEYDGSTYVAFSAAAITNIYDYSQDPKMRDMARAALDWLAAAQAIKYFHGCNVGPEARGFATNAVVTHSDWMNWIWFGDSARKFDLAGNLSAEEIKRAKHAVVCQALSTYRPHPIIRNIANKKVTLPFEARGSKPSYYGPKDNKDQEYLYFNDLYAMGTLYSPEDGIAVVGTILPQTTMFKLAIRGKDDIRTFGMANGYHGHFPVEGRTPYDQYHQYKDTAINICYVNKPEDQRTKHRSILAVPLGLADPHKEDSHKENGWFFWRADNVLVAARPLNGKADFADLVRWDEKSKKEVKIESKAHRWLVSPGALSGWVVRVGQVTGSVPNQSRAGNYAGLDDFIDAVISRCKVDLSKFEKDREVSVTTDAGDTLRMRHTAGPGGKPEAWTNGKALVFNGWPVFESPYVREEAGSGIVRLTDGHQKLLIDFTGDWPTMREGE